MRLVTQRRNALISHSPKPADITTSGSVKSTSNGFRKALKTLRITTTTNSVVPSAQWMPGTRFAANVTPVANTSQRSTRLKKPLFIVVGRLSFPTPAEQ